MTNIHHSFRWLTWPVLCGVLIGIIILENFPSWLNDEEALSLPNEPAARQGTYSYASAVKQAAPAVVNIYTSKTVKQQLPQNFDNPYFRYFLERNKLFQKERIERSLGSGVIMSAEGYLLTNNHVIAGADEILIALHDGREALASIVGTDPETDLAVLKIDLNNLTAITVADPSQAMIGDVVLAIGNPYGFGQSVSQGIISATGRYGLKLNTYENFIQTDAAINPGNSGGALIDARGRLLGINSAIYSRSGGSQGIGLAIPSDLAQRIMVDLIQYGKVIRGWLGIEVKAALSTTSNLPMGNGIVITATYPGGPADQAGLLAGDIIKKIGGQPVGDGQAGMNFIGATRPGDTVEIALFRQGKALTINAMVGNRPE
jgi:serine protease DegS